MATTEPRVVKPYLPSVPVTPPQKRTATPPARGSVRRLLLGTLAWGMALGALSLTGAEPGRTWAMLIVAGAGVLAVLAWGGVPLPALWPPVAGSPLVRWSPGRVLRLAGIAGASVLVVLADMQFLAHPDETFGLAGALWLAGMAVLLAATVAWPRDPAAPAPAAPGLPWTWPERGALAGLVLVALLLRVWDLQDIPFTIHRDEILSGGVALSSYLQNPVPVSIYHAVWSGIDLPALWFLGLSTAMQIGGQWLGMVRLPASLFGAGLVLPFYGLIREGWGRTAALAGTAVLAVSAVDFQFSRVTINNIVTPFFWTVCFFFLLRGLRTRRPVAWVLAGVAAGLSEYAYYGTHLLPFVLLAFAAYLLVIHRRQVGRTLGQMGLLVLGYLVAFGPLLAYFLRFRPDIYFGRGAAQGVLMWDHIPRDWADWQLMWKTLWPLFAENLLGMSTDSDAGSFYSAPLLFPAEAALLVLGVALLIWRWRHPPAFLLLLSGLGVLIAGGTLVHGVPFIQHWTPAFPSFYAAIGIALGAWASTWAGLGSRWQRLGPVLLGALLLIDAGANVDFYFDRNHNETAESEIRAAQSRWQAALGPSYQVYTVGPGSQLYEPLTNSFLVHGQVGEALTDPAGQLPVGRDPAKGLAFAFFADTDQYRPLVEQLYPGGREGEIRARNGAHLYTTYQLTPEQATAAPPRTLAQAQALAGGLLPVRLTLVRQAAGDPSWQAARGVAVLPDGAVVVGDSGNHRVLVYAPDGTLRARWGSAGSGDGQFDLIADVAVTPDGTIAVLDAGNGGIQRFTADGRLLAHWPGSRTGLHIASGLAAAADGTLWVADTSAGVVVHLGPDGAPVAHLHDGSNGRAGLDQPVDVAVLPDGSVYVADLTERIVRFSAAGQMDGAWSAAIGGERGGSHLTLWQDGLAFTNPDGNTLEFLSPGAGAVRPLDLTAQAQLGLAKPIGIASAASGQLVVLCSDGNRALLLAPP